MHKIALAPTTLPNTPPLAYIDAAVRAGYDSIGMRLFRFGERFAMPQP